MARREQTRTTPVACWASFAIASMRASTATSTRARGGAWASTPHRTVGVELAWPARVRARALRELTVPVCHEGRVGGPGTSAFAALKAHVRYGVEPHESVRPAVVSALAAHASRLAPHQQKEAIDVLADLLRDPAADVRSAAAAGLVQLRAREHAGSLEQLK